MPEYKAIGWVVVDAKGSPYYSTLAPNRHRAVEMYGKHSYVELRKRKRVNCIRVYRRTDD